MQDSFQVGDRVVSPRLNTISRNGTTNRVEPKAMQVLTCLAAKPGEVISKENLIDAVWADTHVTDDVLTGCISALRKAFDDNPKAPAFIQTIPKSGYRLIAPVVPLNGRVNAIQKPGGKRNLYAMLAIGLVLFVAAAFWFSRDREAIHSVAILPFANSTHDPATEYLSDGISESIIESISQLPNLRVTAWSTVARFKNPAKDPLTIGNELGVKAILTGSIVQSGDQLRIQTELVDLATGSRLWGERYTRQANEVIPLQKEIAVRISRALRLKLSGQDTERISKQFTTDPEAYTLYLKGRYFWNKRDQKNLQKAISYFRQAIERDPTYALAYAGLADTYNLMDDWGKTPPSESFPLAKAAALKALEIDDSLAEAHTSLAFIKANYEWDFPAAEKEFQRAIALNPNYATAHQWYAIYLATRHRFDDAEREIKTAQTLDPLSLIINLGVGEIYEFERKYDLALTQFQKTLELDPNFMGALGHMVSVYEWKGMEGEAKAAAQKAAAAAGDANEATAFARLPAEGGKQARARYYLQDDLKNKAAGKYVAPDGLAENYMVLGDRAQAMRWLNTAYSEHASGLVFLTVNPNFDPIRHSPEFQQLLRKMGFQE
jgi:TolB-like protein/DNA-binding winged helix-turn-helix (wHTH) protein